MNQPPPIFCQENRPFWVAIRRLLLYLISEIDKAYGFDTRNGGGK